MRRGIRRGEGNSLDHGNRWRSGCDPGEGQWRGNRRRDAARIFDMFVQADSSLNRRQGGLGIGLTLVKSLVEMHGGAVQATSEGLGKGSEFAVRLPLLAVADALCVETNDSAAEPRFFPCRRILVVDDLRPAALIVAALLPLWGNRCEPQRTARRAGDD